MLQTQNNTNAQTKTTTSTIFVRDFIFRSPQLSPDRGLFSSGHWLPVVPLSSSLATRQLRPRTVLGSPEPGIHSSIGTLYIVWMSTQESNILLIYPTFDLIAFSMFEKPILFHRMTQANLVIIIEAVLMSVVILFSS